MSQAMQTKQFTDAQLAVIRKIEALPQFQRWVVLCLSDEDFQELKRSRVSPKIVRWVDTNFRTHTVRIATDGYVELEILSQTPELAAC